MRRGVGIQLVGGPADDRLICIPEDPMNPPEVYKLMAMNGSSTVWLIYRREANKSDEGPLWLYRFAGRRPA